MPLPTALCPSCEQRKYSAAKSPDGLCDECAGRDPGYRGRPGRKPKKPPEPPRPYHLPGKEERSLERIFSLLESWVARNDARIGRLPTPTYAREGLDEAHTGLAKAVEHVIPPDRRDSGKTS